MPPDPFPALDLSRLSVWERFDTLCRCIVAALMASRRLRRDSRFLAVFTKPPWQGAEVARALNESAAGRRLEGAPPHGSLEVAGRDLRLLYAEERWVAATLQRALKARASGVASSSSARLAGWRLGQCASLRDALQELLAAPDVQLLLLDEEAPLEAEAALELAKREGARRLVFVLGDQAGLAPEVRQHLAAGVEARVVRLGSTPLLTSQRITVLNYLVDRTWDLPPPPPCRDV